MLKETVIGGVMGAAIPGAGAGASRLARGVAGKVFSSGANRATKALADDVANAGADAAGGSASSKAATEVANGGGAKAPTKPFESCPTGNSFTPSTRVVMGDGSVKPIGKIRVGDKVVAANPASGVRTVRTVTRVFINHDKDLVDVKVLAGGKSAVIGTTSHHLFFDSSTGAWVPAGELKAGQKLSTVSPDVVASVATQESATKPTGSRFTRRLATGVLAVGLMVGPGSGAADAATVPAATSSVMSVAAEISVQSATDRSTAEGADRYDLTVAGDHTYYVLADRVPVLVHNCDGLQAFADSQRAVPRTQYASEYTSPSGAKYYSTNRHGQAGEIQAMPELKQAVQAAGHHGGCAEVGCLIQAYKAEGPSGIIGGVMRTVNVRNPISPNAGLHGTPATPCGRCARLLSELGIQGG